MRFLPHSLALLALAAGLGGAAAAEAPALSAPLPAHTALYSFADIYRLTVGNAASTAATGASLDFPVVAEPSASAGSSAPADYQVRVAAAAAGDEPQAGGKPLSIAAAAPQSSSLPTSYVFSIVALPDPGRWLLLLSGLALAGWVARRRLSNSL